MIHGYLNDTTASRILNDAICRAIFRPNRQGFGDLYILTIKTILNLDYMPILRVCIVDCVLDEGEIFAGVDVMNPIHRNMPSNGHLIINPDCWYLIRTVVNKFSIRYIQNACITRRSLYLKIYLRYISGSADPLETRKIEECRDRARIHETPHNWYLRIVYTSRLHILNSHNTWIKREFKLPAIKISHVFNINRHFKCTRYNWRRMNGNRHSDGHLAIVPDGWRLISSRINKFSI